MGSRTSAVASKFKLHRGITLFDSEPSPCARRVRMTLLEKGIPFQKVNVDILKGEQMSAEYVQICPNKKVPAISFVDVPGIKDCCLFESNVITELLDGDTFPGPKLYPTDLWKRAQVKMWQDWELGLVDDFVPMIYSNVIPFLLQLKYKTKEIFLKTLPNEITDAKREFWSRTYDAQLATQEELKNHAIVCYQSLIPLEKALEGQEFLVGDSYTTADLSVLPRVSMYYQAGLTIPESHFPNITAYLNRLGNRTSILNSQSFMSRMINKVWISHRDRVVWLGNWRSGRNLQAFDASACLEQALSMAREWKHNELWQAKVAELEANCVLLADYAVYPECWQIKLLLKEKGIKFTVLTLNVQDVLGHWAGSDGIIRIHHNGHDVVGIRAVLDYLDASFREDTPRFIPEDALQRAKVQIWQAWDITLGYLELGPLLEVQLVHKFLTDRFLADPSVLDAIKTDLYYCSKFATILKCFICGLVKKGDTGSNNVLQHLKNQYEDEVTKATDAAQNTQHWEDLLQDRLKHLEAELQTRGQYLMGEEATLADISIFCRLCFMDGLDILDRERNRRVVQWFESLKEARPHFSAISKEITKLFL